MSNFMLYEPFYEIRRLSKERSRSRSPGRHHTSHSNHAAKTHKPRMDLHEDADKNLVTAQFELPGVNKQDVAIEVHDGRLTVSTETRPAEELLKGGYAVRERVFGKFARTLRLPEGVKDTDVKATMDCGVLTVTFPKDTVERASKRIKIN